MLLRVKRLSPHAVLPKQGSKSAAGYDLAAARPCVVKAHSKALVKTDLAIVLPPGVYGRIAPRSGLAWKKHLDVGAGVIDPDYRGPIGIVLFNHSNQDYTIRRGDRVAQLILERFEVAAVEEVKELDTTARGPKGFGSTGRQ